VSRGDWGRVPSIPISRLGKQIAEVAAVLNANGVGFALIGFKLQALVNDPSRTRDLEDIRALLRANRGMLDTAELRG